MKIHLAAPLLVSLLPGLVKAGDVIYENTVRSPFGDVGLAAGPKVEGVVFLQGEEWTEDVYRAFHSTPWLDGISVRMIWSLFEPKDEEFDWSLFDRVIAEAREYNRNHPGANCLVHIRVMGGRFLPKWMEEKGVKFFDSSWDKPGGPENVRAPLAYDNPEYLNQVRQVYRAMYERYKDEPLVAVYHGTWSGGPWDEIYLPHSGQTMPPDYSDEKFIEGMKQQLELLIDEFSAKGKVAELAFSGQYPLRTDLDVTGPLTDLIIERLGKHSPYLYIQTNGWGLNKHNQPSMSGGHQLDVNNAFNQGVNLSFQAIGTNVGPPWIPQGDWLPLVKLAQAYSTSYVEIYYPDFDPLDTEHHIVEAMTGENAPEGFIGYRPWLKQRNRTLYLPKGKLTQTFRCGSEPKRVDRLVLAVEQPPDTTCSFRARTRLAEGEWSDWLPEEEVNKLPPGTECEVEATLETNDGYYSPRIVTMWPDEDPQWDKPCWVSNEQQAGA